MVQRVFSLIRYFLVAPTSSLLAGAERFKKVLTAQCLCSGRALAKVLTAMCSGGALASTYGTTGPKAEKGRARARVEVPMPMCDAIV